MNIWQSALVGALALAQAPLLATSDSTAFIDDVVLSVTPSNVPGAAMRRRRAAIT